MAAKLRGFVFNNCGSFMEIKLTQKCISECTDRGSNDSNVSFWVEKLRPYLDEINPEFIVNCLKSTGGFEDLTNHESNLSSFIWMAAHNAKENSDNRRKCWAYMEAY